MLFNDHRYSVDPTLAHRRADATVTVVGPDGHALADTEVVVAQRDHAFRFGCIGFDFLPYVNGELSDTPAAGTGRGLGTVAELERLAEHWFELFNVATLPFYWRNFEREPGQPDTERLRRTARWFADRGVPVKGHPLTWHTLAPQWLLELSNDEVLERQRARIERDVGEFAGLIDTWDVLNEGVIMPVFEAEENAITRVCRQIGRIGMIQMAFERARASNPGATLLLNDFDMSTAFECLIEGVLEAGVQIDAIGLQSHMHQGYWGEEKTLETIERFARYGLPLHFTETTIVSGHLMPPEIVDLNDYQIPEWPSTPEDEERQADELVRHYRTLLSHPAVEAMTYWGLTDAGAWLGAPAGLVRADGSPKPAFDAVRGLVKGEWWLAPTTMRTDGSGQLRVSGFLGHYEVTAGDRTGTFHLADHGEVDAQAQLHA